MRFLVECPYHPIANGSRLCFLDSQKGCLCYPENVAIWLMAKETAAFVLENEIYACPDPNYEIRVSMQPVEFFLGRSMKNKKATAYKVGFFFKKKKQSATKEASA